MSKKGQCLNLLNSLNIKVLDANPLCSVKLVYTIFKQSNPITMKKQFILPMVIVQGLLPMAIFCAKHNGFAEAIFCVTAYVGISIITIFIGQTEKEIPMSVMYNGQEFKDEQTLHEWREEFEFDYFIDNASQN